MALATDRIPQPMPETRLFVYILTYHDGEGGGKEDAHNETNNLLFPRQAGEPVEGLQDRGGETTTAAVT